MGPGARVSGVEHDRLCAVAVDLAVEFGVDVWLWPDSRRVSQKGWPDLTFVGLGGIIAREVKTGSAKPTRDQRRVGYLLIANRISWSIWREDDFASGRVRDEINRIARLCGGFVNGAQILHGKFPRRPYQGGHIWARN